MLAMMPLVNPSISSGLAFLATLANDFEMMVRPFLRASALDIAFLDLCRREEGGDDILDSLVCDVRQDHLMPINTDHLVQDAIDGRILVLPVGISHLCKVYPTIA